jgi:hypothetical protein
MQESKNVSEAIGVGQHPMPTVTDERKRRGKETGG